MSAIPLDALQSRATASDSRSAMLDVRALTAYLDDEHAALKTQIRAVLSRPEFAYRYDLERAAHCDLILQRCTLLAQHRWADALFPDADGRSDVAAFLAALETLGISDPNLLIKFGLQFGLFGGAIVYLGSTRHHRTYLPQVADMSLVGCYGMTELGHGSDIRAVRTTATYDVASGEFVVHTPEPSARKQFIGNAARHARMAVVFAQLMIDGASKGVFGVLVPIRHPDGSLCRGVSIEETGTKAGLLGIDNGCMGFDHVRVPLDNLLDRFGTVSRDGQYRALVRDPSALTLRSMSGGRVAMALAALSATKSALTIAIRHGTRRRQFGAPEETLLLDHPAHQRRLLPRLATAFAIDAALKHAMAMARASQGMSDRGFEELAAGLKAYATWNAGSTLQECREACGGQGYLARNRLGVVRADIDPMTTLEGDNTLLYMLNAKGALKGLRDKLTSHRLAPLRHLLGLRWQRLRLAIALRARPAASLRDPDRIARVLQYREQATLWSAARTARQAQKAQGGIDYQTPLLRFAQAHVERLTFEHFCERVKHAAPGLQAVLATLRDLYACTCLDNHLAWHLQAGVLSAGHGRRIEQWIGQACSAIRPHAPALVDGFAIPDECLGAPIARNDIPE